MPKLFKDHVMLSWANLHMDEKDTVEDYNHKRDAYPLVAPFKKISKKNQIIKYRAGLKPKIQAVVNTPQQNPKDSGKEQRETIPIVSNNFVGKEIKSTLSHTWFL